MSNFLYTFISWRYLWRVKVGISTRPWGRRKEVASALGYTVGPYLPMVWAKPVEKAIHTVFAPLNTQTGWINLDWMPRVFRYIFGEIPDYNGKTEHFWIFNVLTGALAIPVLYMVGFTGTELCTAALILLFFPLPFDIIICVILYWIAELFLLHLILPYLSTLISLAWLWVKYQILTFLQL